MSIKHNIERSAELQKTTLQAGADFLKTDLATSFMFARCAGQYPAGSGGRARNMKNALRGYEAINRHMARLPGRGLSASERATMVHDLDELRKMIDALKDR